jgi:hypothetical protein
MAEPAVRLGDIRIDLILPPIPSRQYVWCAYRDGTEESGPVGWGSSSVEAITDLIEQEEDRA